MQTRISSLPLSRGYALIVMLGVMAVTCITLTATLKRTSTNTNLNNRSRVLSVATSAAEAAVEKTVARLSYDFQNYGMAGVSRNLDIYRTNPPTAGEDSYWTNFVFSDGRGNAARTYVEFLTNYSGSLPSQYPGLYTALAPIYRVISNAKMNDSAIVAAVQEDVLLALVPITQYAIFANGLTEFSTCATMTVNGRVHANGPIYTGSSAPLTFNGTVTTTATISSPGWNGQGGGGWTYTGAFNGSPAYRTNVPTVTLSIGTTNVHSVIEIPPGNELATSSAGQTRLYNQAQTVLLVSNSTVTLRIQNGVNNLVPGADPAPIVLTYSTNVTTIANNLPFLSLTNIYGDLREVKAVYATQIDVAKYATWVSSNASILTKFPSGSGTYPTILYVGDTRIGTNSSKLSAVRLINGVSPPANGGLGWSVATCNPLYVLGNYNCSNPTLLGTSNTSATVPCAFMSDALTILSSNWRDSASSNSLSSRLAVDTTINAAILTGNIPSTGSSSSTFSGGIHNLPRLLEDWNSPSTRRLTINTSLMNLYSSIMATHQFVNPSTYYDPPTRAFNFDLNFLDPAKQPPGIPCALVAVPLSWAAPPPNTITYNVNP